MSEEYFYIIYYWFVKIINLVMCMPVDPQKLLISEAPTKGSIKLLHGQHKTP